MFLTPFQKVQFWSMKGVYFLQNANNLNCYFILCINNISYSIYSIFSPWLTLKSWIRCRKKVVQVAQMGGRWGGSNSGNERTAFFSQENVPKTDRTTEKEYMLDEFIFLGATELWPIRLPALLSGRGQITRLAIHHSLFTIGII